MAVETEEEFRAWLEGQPREVCVAIAYRAVLRLFPMAWRIPDKNFSEAHLIALARATIVAGVMAVKSSNELLTAAADAASAVNERSKTHTATSKEGKNPNSRFLVDFKPLDLAGAAAAAAVSDTFADDYYLSLIPVSAYKERLINQFGCAERPAWRFDGPDTRQFRAISRLSGSPQAGFRNFRQILPHASSRLRTRNRLPSANRVKSWARFLANPR